MGIWKSKDDKQPDPKGRTDHWGEPLTKAEGRVYDLRDSGYKGWVDWEFGERITEDQAYGRRPTDRGGAR